MGLDTSFYKRITPYSNFLSAQYKRRNRVIAASETNSSDVDELAQRLAVSEAAEQALGKVIQIIARSAGDLDLSMQTVLEGALDICEAQLGILFRYEAAKGFRAEHMKGVPQPFLTS